jgi:hypothetical protein
MKKSTRIVLLIGWMLTAAVTWRVPAEAASWEPDRFASEDTLELLTVDAEAGDHWFPVWLVVLDGDVYVRLGSRAAGRIERNTRKPVVSVRVAGEQFESVRGEEAPKMADAVAAAMAEKYWSDAFIRHFSHPLTLRLVPADHE